MKRVPHYWKYPPQDGTIEHTPSTGMLHQVILCIQGVWALNANNFLNTFVKLKLDLFVQMIVPVNLQKGEN